MGRGWPTLQKELLHWSDLLVLRGWGYWVVHGGQRQLGGLSG
jgi:hypothetical protein